MKGLPFVAVVQEPGGENAALQAWSGQASAPVLAHNDERLRAHWLDILQLCERLASEPRLLPRDEAKKALVVGISHAICGEDGLGCNRRLMTMARRLQSAAAAIDAERATLAKFRTLYTAGEVDADEATARAVTILRFLSGHADHMAAESRQFLVGDALTAADLYWAAFSNIFFPLPDELCPMSATYRDRVTVTDPAVIAATSPALLAHRDAIVGRFFRIPMDF